MGNPAMIFLVPSVYGLSWSQRLILELSRGPLGILGPVLLLFLLLCRALAKHSPWYVTAILTFLLAVLLLIMFGYL